MSPEREQNPNDELLQRFRDELHLPLSERFYSEEELLTVFDIAGDNYNDYLRTEALLIGMRLYPDSTELLARRAILYRDLDPESLNTFLNDRPDDASTTLLEIMRLSNLTCPRAEAQRHMERFLDTHRLDDDEEVIQFVQAAHTLGLQQWLVERLPQVRSKISYLPTLLYEIAVLSDESPDFAAISARLLEELTELEPYSPEYWVLLALVYLREDRLPEALNAVEYALAIDPDNIEALRSKLRIVSVMPDTPGIEALMERISAVAPDDVEIAAIRLLYVEEKYDARRVCQILDTMPPTVGASRSVISVAITNGYKHLDKLLTTYYMTGHTMVQDWDELLNEAFNSGNTEAIKTVEDVYNGMVSTVTDANRLDRSFIDYRTYFRQGQYDKAIALFGNREVRGALRSRDNLMEVYAMYLLMLLRTDHLIDAIDACASMNNIINDFENRLGLGPVELYGMRCLINDILKRIKSTRPTNWAKYDPLELDK